MDVVKIAMANAAGDGPNQDLSRGGVVDLDLFDRERLFRRAKNGSLDFHLSRFPQGASSEVYKKARGAGQRQDVEVASSMIGPCGGCGARRTSREGRILSGEGNDKRDIWRNHDAPLARRS